MVSKTELCDVGLIGLAVMGENLVLNISDHGFSVCVFNRTTSKIDDFLKNRAVGAKVQGAYSLQDLVKSLKKPRILILLVMAGKPVDDFINNLVPLLDKNDIIIDAGNSDHLDTARRFQDLTSKGFRYIGSGVSGGEMGARYGPSLMPGGSSDAWPIIKPIFEGISAKVGTEPCVTWIGPGGAGHYVKMVHNGIEYGDMQLICEAYHIMKSLLHMSCDEMSKTFGDWNEGELKSYLIEITRDILKYKENGEYLVETIRDTAGQKGTGKLTVISGLDMGIPITLIGEAVFSRCLSALKNERESCSAVFHKKLPKLDLNKLEFINDIKNALYASKIISYTQGFMLLQAASEKYSWDLNFGEIAMIWRGGCIIKSQFLSDIYNAYKKDNKITSLLMDSYFKECIEKSLGSWRRVVSTCFQHGIPIPALSSALSFFDGYSSSSLPANLLQAQRDYFGSHTFELLSEPGKFIHSTWGQK